MIRHILAGAVGLVGMIGAAQAADIPARPYYKAPPPPPVFNWTGFYVGVAGGWTQLETTLTDTGGTTTGNLRDDGWLIGGTIGWNWQRPGSSFVWGIEGDLSYVDVRPNLVGGVCGVAGCGVEQNLLGTLRLRAGIAANNWLFYVTAGGAVGQFDSNVGAIANDETLFGWTVGAGVEVAFGGRWSAKLEYLFIDFEDASVPTLLPVSGDPLEQHVVRLGLNYRW